MDNALVGPNGQLIETFHSTQQAVSIARARAKAKARAAAFREEVRTYEGDNETCRPCLEDFVEGNWLIRLVCRHQFHARCWTDAVQSDSRDCPNCRGSGRIIARFRYIAQRPPSSQSAGSGTTTTELAMPWWTARGQQPEPYFHAAIQLADGRMSLLVDVGAWTNLVGSNWARRWPAAQSPPGECTSRAA